MFENWGAARLHPSFPSFPRFISRGVIFPHPSPTPPGLAELPELQLLGGWGRTEGRGGLEQELGAAAGDSQNMSDPLPRKRGVNPSSYKSDGCTAPL